MTQKAAEISKIRGCLSSTAAPSNDDSMGPKGRGGQDPPRASKVQERIRGRDGTEEEDGMALATGDL